jgi:hypothetical protein
MSKWTTLPCYEYSFITYPYIVSVYTDELVRDVINNGIRRSWGNMEIRLQVLQGQRSGMSGVFHTEGQMAARKASPSHTAGTNSPFQH